MNHFSKNIAVVLPFLVISACAGKGQLADDEAVAEEPFVLPTAADYETPEGADYNVDIALRSDLIDNQFLAVNFRYDRNQYHTLYDLAHQTLSQSSSSQGSLRQ